MVKILITGGAGFIGHHLVRHVLDTTDWQITLIDRLDCSGNLNRLAEIGAAKNPRVRFVYHDLRAPLNSQLRKQIGAHDYIIHLAAATHVDRSIECPMDFVLDNVVGTCNILDFARKTGCKRFVQFSTDEVFGPAPDGVAFLERDRYNSGNPYAATKAGAEELAISYHNTYGVPVIVTHAMNVIGERQHPEKFVPMTIAKVRDGEEVIIHSNPGKTRAGSRYYIHAIDVAKATLFLLKHGSNGSKYNIAGQREVDNLDMARMIAAAVGKPFFHKMVDFHSSRPGHDLRYALNGDKMAAMGWKHEWTIEAAVSQIVKWTLANDHWLMNEELKEVA
jgi:dTDP-glucose 4,6-dehydratase